MPGPGNARIRTKIGSRRNASRAASRGLRARRRKRKLSLTSMEELLGYARPKRPRKQIPRHCIHKSVCQSATLDHNSDEDLVLEDKSNWAKSRNPETVAPPGQSGSTHREANLRSENAVHNSRAKCYMDALPQELLLKIFGYLPLGMLLHTVPQVCKKWEALALDWTLWKAVENLTIKNMVISTAKLRTLLRTIPKLKKLELILRNDTEELLHELIKTHQNLEVLKLDRCYRSTLQMSILSQTVTSILEFCPKLKTVMLTDTYFHSKAFYKCLARKFRNIERINVTCTTKSEMDVFMDNLRETVSEVEFQRVPMMGRADGKQIYWGPILGLVIRPIPTSPFHRQYTHDNYPTYAF